MNSITNTKKRLIAKTELEKREVAVCQATNAKELKKAYQRFFRKSKDTYIDREIFKLISSLDLTILVLRGYEIPDANMRYESNRILKSIDCISKDFNFSESMEKQFWTCIGYQRGVIIEQIENDLEAMGKSLMEPKLTLEREKLLISVHRLIRSKTKSIKEIFASPKVHQTKIDFAAI